MIFRLLNIMLSTLAVSAAVPNFDFMNNNRDYVVEAENLSYLSPKGTARRPESFQRFSSFRSNITGKIAGGSETLPNEFPWMVNLYIRMENGEERFCGGIILNYNFVATAAQCIYPTSSRTEIIVTAGDHDLQRYEPTEQEVGWQRTIIPGDFNPNTLENDIAIIELRTRLNPTTAVRVVALADPTFPASSGERATVIGWGSTTENGNTVDRLRKVTMTTISNVQCALDYSGINPIRSSMICAKGVSGGGGCFGDGGGPLMCENSLEGYFVCGLASFMVECRTTFYPGGFQRMSEFVDWIKRYVPDVLTAGYTQPTTTTRSTTTRPTTTTTERYSIGGGSAGAAINLVFYFLLTTFIKNLM